MSQKIMMKVDAETIQVLLKCAEHHYDGACKAMAKENGLLLRWKSQIESKPESMITGTFNDIDITAKVAEMSGYLPDSKDREIGAKYFHQAIDALKRSQSVYDQFNQVFGDKMDVITLAPGDSVVCDDCNTDYTTSDKTGGLLFQSKAICPDCAPKWDRSAIQYNEVQFIKARCPVGVSFADWVRGLR
jgi:hypothetical protein